MSPIGALAVTTYGMIALAVIGLIALFAIRKVATAKMIFLAMAAYCILSGFVAYTAQPSNYPGAQTIAILAAVLAIAALVLRFVLKKSIFVAKLLLCGSLVVSFSLMFG